MQFITNDAEVPEYSGQNIRKQELLSHCVSLCDMNPAKLDTILMYTVESVTKHGFHKRFSIV